MAGLTFTWALRHQGWAFCTIADDHGQAEAIASDVTGGPEYLLQAIASIARGAATARAEFEAEGTVFRWFFTRDGSETEARLVQADERSSPDSEGTIIWSGSYPIDVIAGAILKGFDQAVSQLGEDGYKSQWGRAFPRGDVEVLRTAALQAAPGQQTPSSTTEPET
jgi:hypothetical protein